MKLGELVDNARLLKALKELSIQAIPAVAAYKIITIAEIRDKEFKKWQDVRNNLLLTYGKKDEKGELVTNTEGTQYILEDAESFNREYAALTTVEVEGLPKLSLEEIKDAKMSAESMQALMPLITAMQIAR